MPDLLPVRVQDQLRHRKPEVRKRKGQEELTQFPEYGLAHNRGSLFFMRDTANTRKDSPFSLEKDLFK